MRFLTLFLPFIAFLMGYTSALMYTNTKTVRVPAVVGKSLYHAVLLLGKYNLGLKLLNVKEDSFLPEGTIVSQVPQQDQQIKLAKSVFVVITKKPKAFLVPSLFGKSPKAILDALKDSYVSVKLVRLESNYKKDRCFAQYPNQGGQAFDGKAVAYVSVRCANLHIMPSFIGYRLDEVEEFLRNHDILFEVFKFFTSSIGHDGFVVSDQTPMPGTIVDLDKTLQVQLKVDIR